MGFETTYSLSIHEVDDSESTKLTHTELLNQLLKGINGNNHDIVPEHIANQLDLQTEIDLEAISRFYNYESVEQWFKNANKNWCDDNYDVFKTLFLENDFYTDGFYVDDDMIPFLEVVSAQPEFKDLVLVVDFDGENDNYESYSGMIYAINGKVKIVESDVQITYPSPHEVANELTHNQPKDKGLTLS